MNVFDKQSGDKQAPVLKIFYGDEKRVPDAIDGVGRQRSPLCLNHEAESFWAGRFPAARLSSRIAA